MKAGDKTWFEGKRVTVTAVLGDAIMLSNGWTETKVDASNPAFGEPFTVKVERVEFILREDYSIKRNVDYAIACKYNDAHLVCADVFHDSIIEVCKGVGLTFKTINTWKAQG